MNGKVLSCRVEVENVACFYDSYLSYLYDSGVFWKPISGAHLGKKQGTNEIWQSKVSSE